MFYNHSAHEHSSTYVRIAMLSGNLKQHKSSKDLFHGDGFVIDTGYVWPHVQRPFGYWEAISSFDFEWLIAIGENIVRDFINGKTPKKIRLWEALAHSQWATQLQEDLFYYRNDKNHFQSPY